MESVASTLARLIASREAVTRADLVRVTGLARSRVTAGLETPQEAGVTATRACGLLSAAAAGRRPRPSPAFGLALVADLGIRYARFSVHDLSEQMLTASETPLDVADGPEPALARLVEVFKTLLARVGHSLSRPLDRVTGLPGPVDVSRGAAVKPPVMPG